MATAGAVPAIDELEARVVGTALPEGSVCIEPYEAWLGDDAMRAAHTETLGLTWILVVALRGMGISIDQLVALAGSSMSDGVLFGGLELTENTPLVTGRTYDVSGVIDAIVRKPGRSGIFDLLTFTLDVRHGGASHGTAECTFILQRGASDE